MRYKAPESAQYSANFHALVYAAGDFYGLPFLKQEAQKKFQAVTEEGEAYGADSCFLAAHTVYTSTPENDRGLRNIVVNIINRHIERVINLEETNQLILKSIPDLSYDLVHQRATKAKQYSNLLRFRCIGCSEDFRVIPGSASLPENDDWTKRSQAFCPSCGKNKAFLIKSID